MNFLLNKPSLFTKRSFPFFKGSHPYAWIFLFVLGLFLNLSAGKAQGDMRFFGSATKDAKPLAGATVTVLMDGHNYKVVTTGRNGKFKFDFDMGHQYRISFSAQGCIDMYMVLDLRVPPDKMNLFPDYAIEVPFFEPNSKTVHVELYKDQPFAKVVYDGKNGFQDDPTYKFVEKVVVDPGEEARRQAALIAAAEQKEEEAKEKKAKEAALAEEQRKAKALAEQKALEDAVARAKDEESRAKAEEELKAKKEETMESEAMRLEKEKQERALLEKKANLQKYNNMKNESEAGSVIQTMRKTAELKAATEALRRQEKEKEERTLVNKQLKVTQVKRLVEAAALTEKIIRISESPARDPKTYSHESAPNVVVSITEGIWSDIRTTLVTNGDFKVSYKKENYLWGSTYYYRNGIEIDEKTYTAELAKYKKK